MWRIFTSATKVVLLLLAVTSCFLIVFIVIQNPQDEKVILPLVTAFTLIVQGVIAFYFGKGQTPPPGQVTVTPAETVSEVNTSVLTSSTNPDPVLPPSE